jgi:hypothetical protein
MRAWFVPTGRLRQWMVLLGSLLGLLVFGMFGWAGYAAWETDQNLWEVGLELLGRTQLAGPAAPRAVSQVPKPSRSEDPNEGRLLGKMVQECSLHDVDGKEVHLKDFVGRMPVVVEFGCFT